MILRSTATLVLSAVVVAGCGSSPSDTAGGARLVATTSIWADIASNVACGAPIPAIIPPGADPHTFEPALRDRETLDHAGAVISNGMALEGSLTDLLDSVGDAGTVVVDMTDHGPSVAGDPHVWQDPTFVAGSLDAIVTALEGAGYPAAEVAGCADGYRRQLIALDTDIRSMVDSIPPGRRVLVTSHDSLAYFAARYGFEVVGTVIPSTNTLAESNAADLARLADVIADRQVPAVFTDRFESSGDAEALAARLGVAVVPLVTDAVTDDPGSDTYVEMMRSNAAAIVDALAP
jgi:zinc/manganese transport system substrate-binding protein